MTDFNEFDKKIIDVAKQSDNILNKMVKTAVKYGHDIGELSEKLGLTVQKINSIIEGN